MYINHKDIFSSSEYISVSTFFTRSFTSKYFIMLLVQAPVRREISRSKQVNTFFSFLINELNYRCSGKRLRVGLAQLSVWKLITFFSDRVREVEILHYQQRRTRWGALAALQIIIKVVQIICVSKGEWAIGTCIQHHPLLFLSSHKNVSKNAPRIYIAVC